MKLSTQKLKILGALFMKVSTLLAVFTLLGCFELSSGETQTRNRCGDAPPEFDTKKITPGMYIRAGSDTSGATVFHTNGVKYGRARYREDNTPGPGRIASENWVYWMDSATQIKGIGLGEERVNSYFSGGWSNEWQSYSGLRTFNKKNVTSSSFKLGEQVQIRNNEGRLIDCIWVFETVVRIGDENGPWPSKLDWSEVWPDSVRRN